MSDAWVWDMYRPARFVKNVKVVTFKDVNVEELAKPETPGPGVVLCVRASSRLNPRRLTSRAGRGARMTRRQAITCATPLDVGVPEGRDTSVAHRPRRQPQPFGDLGVGQALAR